MSAKPKVEWDKGLLKELVKLRERERLSYEAIAERMKLPVSGNRIRQMYVFAKAGVEPGTKEANGMLGLVPRIQGKLREDRKKPGPKGPHKNTKKAKLKAEVKAEVAKVKTGVKPNVPPAAVGQVWRSGYPGEEARRIKVAIIKGDLAVCETIAHSNKDQIGKRTKIRTDRLRPGRRGFFYVEG